jgi:signal transduction histidine kinase/CHASE1-domain containing sensor protein/ActR/RegA family two-component response regulator
LERVIKVNRQYIPVIVVLIIGAVSAMVSFYLVRHIEFLNLKAMFVRDAQNRINAIKREIEINLAAVQNLRSFYISSREVTREEFHEFASRQLLGRPSIKALEWIPRVTYRERDKYEDIAKRYGPPDFQFTELDSQGIMVRAGERDEYFPVYFVEPYEGNEEALGFDLASEPVRAESLNRSRDSGKLIATAQVTLIQDKKRQDGFLVVAPVYRSQASLVSVQDRRENLRGFVLGAFGTSDIVESALSYLHPRGISIEVYDESDDSEENLLYSHVSRMTGKEMPVSGQMAKMQGKLRLVRGVSVGNRKWLIVTKPDGIYFMQMKNWQAWALSISVLMITLLVAHYMKRMADKNEHIQNLVKELSDDIREREKVEDALQEAHKRLLAILDGIDALVYVADMETYELLFVNKYGRDIWGDIQGDLCWKVMQSGQTGPCNFCTNKYLVDSGGRPKGVHTWEFQNPANGRWYYLIDRAIRWIDGRLVRLEIASDITERKALEEERQRSHKLEAVGLLAGGIAHDFNNLLTAIINNVYLSMRAIDHSSDTYKRLEQAEKAIMKASGLTQQLLTFSRGGAPVTRATSITEIMRDSAEFVLRGSNVRCEYEISDDLWPVEVDAGQMSQVFQNLVINADQAMAKGGVIKVSADNTTVDEDSDLPLEEGKYVKISIQDQGTGIPEEVMDKIFDPYFTTKEMGQGLGLAITFYIIKNHGGHIYAESEPGVGTTFTIYLPASDEETSKDESDEIAAITGSGKILIMDDEEMIRQSLGDMISSFGYEVELAKDGKEAVECFEKAIKSGKPFDAVILDLTVPGGMGGKEAVWKLREIDPEIAAIVSSGYSNDPVLADFREYGFNGIIAKPYNPEQMRETLHRVLSGKGGKSGKRSRQ